MNINLKVLTLALLGGALFAQSPQSGSNLTQTTITASLNSSATTVNVGATTGCPASGTFSPVSNPCALIVEHEIMEVLAINSKTLTVQRGAAGTIAEAHPANALAYIGSDSAIKPYPNFQDNYPWTGYTFFSTFSGPNSVAVNEAADVSGKLFYSAIQIPQTTVLTKACLFNGNGTLADKVILAIWDRNGNLLANTAVAGVTQTGTSQYQCIAFTNAVLVQGPQVYYVGVQGNGTTAASYSLYAAGSAPDLYPTGVQTGGTFGTVLNITAPAVTFTANNGPIMAVE